ncbi:hypothetical protein AALA00_05300 [Lachnospiraceae bacterium 46-15]
MRQASRLDGGRRYENCAAACIVLVMAKLLTLWDCAASRTVPVVAKTLATFDAWNTLVRSKVLQSMVTLFGCTYRNKWFAQTVRCGGICI